MTIDEAIEKNRKIAETKKTLYDACVLEEYNRHLLREYKEHEQLAEWLEELKMYKEVGTVEECRNSVLNIQKAYNKAIDDVMNKAKEIQEEQIKNLEQHPRRSGKQWSIYMNTHLGHIQIACKRIIEEQLKVGEKNE